MMMMPACLAVVLALPGGSAARDALIQGSPAHWSPGAERALRPLTAQGRIERNLTADGLGANADARIARLTDAYFDAGKALPLRSDALTVYLRARDPRGVWEYGLFNKRGSHETVTFNLFSVDLPETPGPDIGFELHTEAGFVMVSFPVSAIDATAWHDFVGRYDGRSIALYCDGRLMAKRAWRGALTIASPKRPNIASL